MESELALPPVGERKNLKFQCDPYVDYWMTFDVPPELAWSRIQEIVTPYLRGDNTNTKARSYWLYHAARSGYFGTNAVVGTIAHVLHERIIR